MEQVIGTKTDSQAREQHWYWEVVMWMDLSAIGPILVNLWHVWVCLRVKRGTLLNLTRQRRCTEMDTLFALLGPFMSGIYQSPGDFPSHCWPFVPQVTSGFPSQSTSNAELWLSLLLAWISHCIISRVAGDLVHQFEVNSLKRKGRQHDTPGIHWRHWSQASTSPVNTRAVTLATYPVLCLRYPSGRSTVMCVGQGRCRLALSITSHDDSMEAWPAHIVGPHSQVHWINRQGYQP